jgi:hypothetical protein
LTTLAGIFEVVAGKADGRTSRALDAVPAGLIATNLGHPASSHRDPLSFVKPIYAPAFPRPATLWIVAIFS